MKTAGIARALVLTTALVAACFQFVPTASAAPLSRPINMGSNELAIDGTDIYWTLTHKVNSRDAEEILYRGSFLNKSKVEIGRFLGGGFGHVENLYAGGGQVAISIDSETVDKRGRWIPTTKVIRLSRDGKSRKVIASGRTSEDGQGQFTEKNGAARLNDCGTEVSVLSVTHTGSVVIGRRDSDRNSKSCGRKKNVDHWSYYEQRLDGSQRPIFSTDKAVPFVYKHIRGGAEVRYNTDRKALTQVIIEGDRAFMKSGASGGYFTRDLNTGKFAGPFALKITDKNAGPYDRYAFGSMGANGSIALNLYAFSDKSGITSRSGVFPDSADPSVLNETKHGSTLMYCGSHLLASSTESSQINELDPVTMAVKRVVVKTQKAAIVFGIEIDCDDNYFYGVDISKNHFALLAYPLG